MKKLFSVSWMFKNDPKLKDVEFRRQVVAYSEKEAAESIKAPGAFIIVSPVTDMSLYYPNMREETQHDSHSTIKTAQEDLGKSPSAGPDPELEEHYHF